LTKDTHLIGGMLQNGYLRILMGGKVKKGPEAPLASRLAAKGSGWTTV
jgi:hypothetical protein